MSDISTSLLSSLSGLSSLNGSSDALTGSSALSNSDSDTSFADILSDALSLVNETEAGSSQASLDLLTGNTDNLASSLITTEKAEIALSLTVAIRNKAVDAYKEIMNMQI